MLMFSFREINLMAITILLIILFNVRNKKEKYQRDQKLFVYLLIFNILILAVDTVTWIMSMKSGEHARYLSIVTNTVYYLLTPVPCMLWSVYADYQINKDEKRIGKISIPLSIPILINAVLALLSPIKGLVFYIDSSNNYHRGKLFLLMCLICYFYFVYTFMMLMIRKHKIDKRQYTDVIFFLLPMLLSGVFQILFYDVSILWICMSLSLLIFFINIQNSQIYTDYLTGLYNRRQLDSYLCRKIKNRMHSKYLAGIMIDVDSFKKINDVHGHTAGDNALICVADILKKSFRKNDFIARYGGDEFVVVVEIREKSELIGLINRLKGYIEEYNNNNDILYEISLSIGYDIYKTKSGVSIQKFYKHIDELMYDDKKGRAVS